MKKQISKWLVIVAVVLLFVALALWLVRCFSRGWSAVPAKNNGPIEIMNDSEKRALGLNKRVTFEVVSRDADGKVQAYRIIGATEAQPISLVLMTDAEKVQKNIATSTKAQVLERNDAGEVTAYKIIHNDSDILERY